MPLIKSRKAGLPDPLLPEAFAQAWHSGIVSTLMFTIIKCLIDQEPHDIWIECVYKYVARIKKRLFFRHGGYQNSETF